MFNRFRLLDFALLAAIFFIGITITMEFISRQNKEIDRSDVIIKGMHYVVLSKDRTGMVIINGTRDSLEVSKLRGNDGRSQ